MDVDISVAGYTCGIYSDRQTVQLSCRTVRRMRVGFNRLIANRFCASRRRVRRHAGRAPRAQRQRGARPRAPGRGKMCLRIDRPDHLASRICVYFTGYDSMIFIKARLLRLAMIL